MNVQQSRPEEWGGLKRGQTSSSRNPHIHGKVSTPHRDCAVVVDFVSALSASEQLSVDVKSNTALQK